MRNSRSSLGRTIACLATGIFACLASASVASAAPTWTPSAPLASETGMTPVDAAFAASGAATVVWQHEDVGEAVIEAASRPAFGSFGAPVTLSPAADESIFPQVVESAEGVATVVWMNVTVGAIEAATVRDGVASAPELVSSAGLSAEYPSVAVDAGGAAIVAWTSEHEEAQRVEASYRPAGGGFGTPHVLASEAAEPLPKVAIDGAGEATVAWTTAAHVLEVATASATGSFSAAERPSGASGEALYPSLAVNAAGDRALAWTEGNDTDGVLRVATSAAGSAFGAPTTVSRGSEAAELAQVGLSSSGEPTVAWMQNTTVEVAEANAAGAFSVPQRLAYPAELPSIAENEAGDTLVTWLDPEGGEDTAEAAYRPAGGGFGAAHVVSASGSSVSQEDLVLGYVSPVVAAVDGEGDGLAAFDVKGEGAPSVALLDAAGPALNGLSIPATGTVGTPVSFSVSPADQITSVASTTWAFGDATSASGATVTHAFANPGTYSVSVTSTDVSGNSTTKTGAITISPAPAAPPPPPAEALPKFAGARIVTDSARANKKGGFRLRVRCIADTDCTGAAKLTLELKVDKLPAAAIRLGKDKFRAASGARVYVTFKLKKSLLALLRKQGKFKLTAVVEASDYRGQQATTKAKVTLKPPKAAKKKKRHKRH